MTAGATLTTIALAPIAPWPVIAVLALLSAAVVAFGPADTVSPGYAAACAAARSADFEAA